MASQHICDDLGFSRFRMARSHHAPRPTDTRVGVYTAFLENALGQIAGGFHMLHVVHQL